MSNEQLLLVFKDRAELERQVIGALRAAIKDHGPITLGRIDSANKRVSGQLLAFRKKYAMNEAGNLIDRLTEQGCFTSDLQIEQPAACTCGRDETATPGLSQFVWDENCPVHRC